MRIRTLCVFCGSSTGSRPGYAVVARELGRWMAGHGIRLVYGGGKVGLMGIVADAVLDAGGQVTGVIPDFLKAKEVAHPGLSELIVTGTMHERKARMAQMADAFVALPGGFGTFDELFEILTWAQLSLHGKPVALFNAEGFYDPLMALARHGVNEGFIQPGNLEQFALVDSLGALESYLSTHVPRTVHKWNDLSKA
ncbi:LOG family protein [Paludibacterium paludis]|uniref:Cytokinin riboside 5'-monophosphate phosphoribohydrolase n=1 Tax=Paludibacterium paludis TaxID=1225769 RepID=A0A918P4K4_9NEIS|nr:TIGR00730 family Rossman fold protein [Paludibacterium paludis]GGY22556.1 cytokinin riboside 5'-monophosphate phosphoribohydrolase [Paludibacterium paludis]